MDDFALFGDDRGALIEARDRLAAWLTTERPLTPKEADARPQRTSERVPYLGYVATRGGLSLGHKARARLREHLDAAPGDVDRVRASLSNYAAVWRVGP